MQVFKGFCIGGLAQPIFVLVQGYEAFIAKNWYSLYSSVYFGSSKIESKIHHNSGCIISRIPDFGLHLFAIF